MLSRVADHLYWMGRYMERVDSLSRLFDAYRDILLETPHFEVPELFTTTLGELGWPIGADMRESLVPLAAEHEDAGSIADALEDLLEDWVFRTEGHASLLQCVVAARENARQARDHISSEMWEHINAFYLLFKSHEARATWKAEPENIYRLIARSCRLYQGCIDASMNRSEGWHFARLGRYLEQAVITTTMLEAHVKAQPFEPGKRFMESREYLASTMLLRANAAGEAYTRAHTAELKPERLLGFLLLDASFPHSVRFATERVCDALEQLSTLNNSLSWPVRGLYGEAALGPMGELKAALLGSFPTSTNTAKRGLSHPSMNVDPLGFLTQLRERLLNLHLAVHETYIAYPIEYAPYHHSRTA